MKKVIRNGKVAVLYSSSYGAGWYTWNSAYPEVIFLPEIVEMIIKYEDEDFKDRLISAKIVDKMIELGYEDGYWGGAEGLTIRWLEEGTAFRITEYDGAESVEVINEYSYIIA